MSKYLQSSAGGLALVGLLLAGGPAGADSPATAQDLTLQSALTLARQNNPQLEAARLRIEEARGELTSASLLLVDNPELDAEAGPRRLRSGTGGETTEVGVGIEQRFELGGQREHRIDRARAEVEASEATFADAQRVIEFAVARAFHQRLAADLRLQLLEENESLLRGLYEVSDRRLEAGEGTPLELNTARIRLAEARRRKLAARMQSHDAAVRLAEVLGLAPSAEIALEGELSSEEPPPDIDRLLAHATRSRPDLAAVHREIEAAGAAVELADAGAWPDLGVGVGYEREEDDEIFTAGLRIGLPFFSRNQGKRARSRAARDRVVAEKDSLSLAIQSEVLRASFAYEQARSTLQLYDDEVLQAQAESLELLQRALEAGEVGIPDVIIVQREVVEGREGYLDVRLDLALARSALLASVNLPQDGPLQGAAP